MRTSLSRRRVSILLRFSGRFGGNREALARRSFSFRESGKLAEIRFPLRLPETRTDRGCFPIVEGEQSRGATALILERARSQRCEGVNCRTRGGGTGSLIALLLSVVGHCYLCTRDPRCDHNLPIFPWGCCPMFITRGMLNVAAGGSRARGGEG